jgi:hypothetical protein
LFEKKLEKKKLKKKKMQIDKKQILIDGLLGSFFIELEKIDYKRLYLDVKESIFKKFKIPLDDQRLIFRGSNLESICRYNSELLEDNNDRNLIGPIHFLLPLKGGKGGFGSLLRGGPKGIKVNKVTNRDACRDLSGRRLRHVEGERNLKDWVDNVRDENLDQKMGLNFVEQKERENLKQQTLNNFTLETKDVKQKINESLKKGIETSKRRKLEKKLKKQKQGEEDDGKQELEEQQGEQEEKKIHFIEEKIEKNLIKEEQENLLSGDDLSKYTSAKELEELGLEKLKNILESKGAKCGGTLTQRAERLFSIKDLKSIPQEYKATSNNNKKKRKKK